MTDFDSYTMSLKEKILYTTMAAVVIFSYCLHLLQKPFIIQPAGTIGLVLSAYKDQRYH